MNKIKVSIMIPVYNQKDLVVRALDSIPIRDDIEVIVCDDCSTDGTYEVLQNYTRIPLKLFRNETNKGAGASRNICIDNSIGEYIFGLDSDDELITEAWSQVVDNYLDKGFDLVRINRLQNDGSVHNGGVAFHTRFLKRSTLGDLRCRLINHAEDWFLDIDLRDSKKINELHSEIIAYRYNYPREGSISWNWEKYKIED